MIPVFGFIEKKNHWKKNSWKILFDLGKLWQNYSRNFSDNFIIKFFGFIFRNCVRFARYVTTTENTILWTRSDFRYVFDGVHKYLKQPEAGG